MILNHHLIGPDIDDGVFGSIGTLEFLPGPGDIAVAGGILDQCHGVMGGRSDA
jgi:hypothetical protein